IDDRKGLEEVEGEGILRVDVEDRRGAADRLRAEARARPVGDGGVEGNAPDHRVRALHVLGELAAHEGKRAGIGRLRLAAGRAASGEGAVDGVGWHVSSSFFARGSFASLKVRSGLRALAPAYRPDMASAQQKSGPQ